jgi:nicotinate phosphoribosyltransferase
MPIINTHLDTDLYKLTMQQAVLHQFPGTEVEYAFKCRTPDIVWTEEMVTRINEEIDNLCSLRYQTFELSYLSLYVPWLKKDFLDFLTLFQLNRSHIHAFKNPATNQLEIRIKGSWFLVEPFEVPVLAIVEEVYNNFTHPEMDNVTTCTIGRPIIRQKIEFFKKSYEEGLPIFLSDFSTRRRISYNWQRDAVVQLKGFLPKETFVGTSNVDISRIYNRTPIGTMAHEWIQAGQNIGVRLVDSQKRMLQAWVDEYRGNLGIALSDTLGVDAFIRDFDSYFAKLYDGVRHDSGDPIVWGNKIIKHYEDMKIDPTTKSLIFSDSLTFPRAIEIAKAFKGRTKVSFGIGTNIANDFPGVTPLNIVIKMVKCNGQPVAKISDSPGKTMCEDQEYVTYLKSVFGIRE